MSGGHGWPRRQGDAYRFRQWLFPNLYGNILLFNNQAEHFEAIRQSKAIKMTGLGQKEKPFRYVVFREIFLRR